MVEIEPREFTRPRVLRVDLSSARSDRRSLLAARPEEWRASTPALDRIGSWSGLALALALIHESLDGAEPTRVPFVLAAGDSVRRGLPTAARATIVSRSPLTGRLVDGQVGSDLARRIARVVDALVLTGRTNAPGAVLHLAGGGRVELCSFPELAGCDPGETARALLERLGPCATLCVGAAGEKGFPFACLAAGADPPSLVGGGGLGAAFAALGLKAVAVSAAPVVLDADADDETGRSARELWRRLLESPRLAARSMGGTLEIQRALSAEGALRARDGSVVLDPASLERAVSSVDALAHSRAGCDGCPTPCGFVFERTAPSATDHAGRRGARFSAVHALGLNLGLERFDDALELLEICDRAAMDAREVGALLALAGHLHDRRIAQGAPPSRSLWGDRDALRSKIDELLEQRGDGPLMALGAERMAEGLGLTHAVRSVRGRAVPSSTNLAQVLGECVSARGSDPLRTFPFLLNDACDRRLIERLLAPLPLPRGAEDPRDPTAKGRIVWWHENFMAGVDLTGFCAFSAAGLLSDGVCDLDELAAWIAPAALLAGEHDGSRAVDAGRRLLAAGASIVALEHALNRRLDAAATPEAPQWAARVLAHPHMAGEYARLRGLAQDGSVSARAWSALGTDAILDLAAALDPAPCEADVSAAPDATVRAIERPSTARGVFTVRTFGPLAAVLERESSFELDLPQPLSAALVHIATQKPGAARFLMHGDRFLPAVYASSRPEYACARALAREDLVHDGDVLDLVLALSGG